MKERTNCVLMIFCIMLFLFIITTAKFPAYGAVSTKPHTTNTVTPTPPPPPPSPPPPPPKKEKIKVYLTGSRHFDGKSVGDYMRNWTASKKVREYIDQRISDISKEEYDELRKEENKNINLSNIDRFYSFLERLKPKVESVEPEEKIFSLPKSVKEEYNKFFDKIYSWPASAEVYNSGKHINGSTYIVDEDGNILGTILTSSYLGNIPGMTYVGDPWRNDGYNQVWVGPGSLNYEGMELEVVAFTSVSPIIIDLDGNGKADVDRHDWVPHSYRFNMDRAKMFDINGDGDKDLTEWLGVKDGLLVAPIDEVKVFGGRELFGNAVGFVDGYQKLALLRDTNDDYIISGDELEGLKVWVDKNQNAECEPDELTPVQELGITSIDTDHKDFKSTCTMNGKTTTTWDWWPTVMMVRKR